MIWIISLVLMIVLLLLTIPIAPVMVNLGLLMGTMFSDKPLYRAIGEISWSANANFVLFCIPLFILLGEILVKCKISDRIYRSVNLWLTGLPGGLMHANILTCALFAATSGSSVATAATIGTTAIPQSKKYGYHNAFFAASIAAGGTIGILIPPSINFIVYGSLTNTSIPRLFMAGLLPGIILTLMFMFFILLISYINPKIAGIPDTSRGWREKIKALTDLLPVALLFLVIIGSIYTGFATPTESAALGVVAAIIIAACYRELSLKNILDSIKGTIETTGMIMLILLAANFLNYIFIALNMQNQIVNFLDRSNITPLQTLVIIIFMYIILGFFIETLSMMVLTIPIVHPIIVSIGYDPIWFGVILVLLIEVALITPPVGLNLYVIQGIRKEGSIKDLSLWCIPFVFIMLMLISLLIIYPNIALYILKFF